MTNLTINQIMCLLDVIRGTSTQITIGTHLDDVQLLCNKGLMAYTGRGIEPTERGLELVKLIKEISIVF